MNADKRSQKQEERIKKQGLASGFLILNSIFSSAFIRVHLRQNHLLGALGVLAFIS
ncbi:MAG TPA: hypothetical protein VM658_07330 [bacterium]|nr:hypothetical protein [bacterium]